MEVKLQSGDTIAIPEGCKAIVKDGSVVFEKDDTLRTGKGTVVHRLLFDVYI